MAASDVCLRVSSVVLAVHLLLLTTTTTAVETANDGEPRPVDHAVAPIDEGDSSTPGVAYEFKLHIDAGKEDCFYQAVEPSANFFVAFQVIRGGDGKAGLAVRHPNGDHVHPYQWKTESEYEEVSRDGGIYEVCVDNQFSRFAAKLIHLYISSFRYDKWESYTAEVEQLDVSVSNVTETLKSVDVRIGEMLRHQQYGRRHEARDYQLLLANNSYVQYWSIAQCAIVMIASSFQVYFVRKLFDVKNTTPTFKPRA